jgi:two-component system, chemotaxis family, sensor kinase CheA
MSLEQEMQAALGTFVVEGQELLQDLESGLLGLEEGGDSEIVNALFRAAHTIKGSSGLFGLDHLVRFTHVMESVLDRLRNGELDVTSELVGALLPCVDHLGLLMTGVAGGRIEEDEESAAAGLRLLATLQPFLAGGDAAPGAPHPATDASTDASTDAPTDASTGAAGGGTDGAARRVHLSLGFGVDCLRNGMDPLAFVRYLSTLGDVQGVRVLAGLLPEPDSADPESCYLDFEVTLATRESLAEVESVFEFVREDSRIRLVGPESSVEEAAELVTSAGPLADDVFGALVGSDVVDASALAAALGRAPESVPPSGPVASSSTPVASSSTPVASSSTPVASPSGHSAAAGPVEPRVPEQGRGPKTQPAADRRVGDRRAADKPAAQAEGRSIRIDAGRLDRLIDAVGELVIAGASAELSASHNRDEALVVALNEIMRLVEEVRDSALQLRMVPIGTTFSRFQRVVRDVSADLGKDIGLVISGGDTEVDKALVEQIGDPLMHLVRNSMDHGIEQADVRAARGKPARGTLRLNAFHDSGSIVIEVGDDGGGLDPGRILDKAVDRGLVEPGAGLSDPDLYSLIFEPGFSTKEQVSNLSGRGVGLDVVKRNVTSLRGTIDVDNRPGEGCTMRIRLPLTLAIIDGFMVVVGGATFVVPLDWVVECVELPPGSELRDCMDLRGEVLPFIRLRSLFGIGGERPRRENVVVVEYAGMKIGLVVDTLMGEFQTVIKPLGRLFEHVRGIGGSTILGNGEVALIIDVPMLIRSHTDRPETAASLAALAGGAAS